jgi:hypothetical protein
MEHSRPSDPAESSQPGGARPVRVRHLHDPESDDLSAHLDAEARVALVWELSRRMWELTGRPVTTYERGALPVRIIRGP